MKMAVRVFWPVLIWIVPVERRSARVRTTRHTASTLRVELTERKAGRLNGSCLNEIDAPRQAAGLTCTKVRIARIGIRRGRGENAKKCDKDFQHGLSPVVV